MKIPLPLICWLFLTPALVGADDSRTPFALVQDKDGFVNVRKTPAIDGEIIAKVDHGAVVFTYDRKSENGWVGVQYRYPREEPYFGYIHESRLRSLDDFDRFEPKLEGKTAVLAGGPLKIEIEREPFDPFPVPVTVVRQKGHESVARINYKPFYGTDGSLPRTKYRRITIFRGEHRENLPDEALGDLFQPNLRPEYHQLFYDEDNDTAFLCGFNSDAAGSYQVVFRIVKGKYRDRFLFSGH